MADDEMERLSLQHESCSGKGASGARGFVREARGDGVNQDERLDQISPGGQLRFGSLWKVRNRYDIAASSANPAFVRSVWQLFLRIR